MHTISSSSLMHDVRSKIQDISMTATIILASLGAGISPLFLYQMVSAAPMNTVYVDNTKTCSDSGPGTRQLPFCTVQRGVNAVPNSGGTVNVSKGTYPEQVVISGKDNLTVSGTGNKTVIQEPSSSLAGGAIIDVTNAQNLDLNQLTVAGPFTVNSCATEEYGIRLGNGVSASLQHLDVTDVRAASDAFFGCQQGIGIRVGRQSTGDVATAKLNDVTVTGYQKGGIVVDNTGSDAVIDHSSVTGRGPTDLTAQNGIQISRGATATISHTTVKDNVYTPQSVTATGLLIYQAGRVTITQNTFNHNDIGTDIDTHGSTFRQNTANNNVFNGFYVEPTASGNTFTQNSALGTSNSNPTPLYPSYDVEDDSVDGGTLGTANTWHQTDCKTSHPDGLCKL